MTIENLTVEAPPAVAHPVAATPGLLHVEDVPLGAACRQGDIYLVRLAELPKRLELTLSQQLAPGERPGARHVVAGNVAVYRVLGEEQNLLGPVIQAAERFVVRHPEHAAMSLPAGIYQVRYQKRYTGQQQEFGVRALD